VRRFTRFAEKDSMKKSLAKIKKLFLDLFFPQFCVGCNTEGFLLCKKCEKNIIKIGEQVCPSCLRLNKNGKICQKCAKNFEINGVLVGAYFEEGPIKEMIHNFKYNHALELKKNLAKIMVNALPADLKIDVITFAPLHHQRLAERGFNQAEILAQEVSKNIKIPSEELLVKTRYTKRQVGLSGKKRRTNLEGVFKVHKAESLKGKRILIVDDVTTTGATLNECAKVLKNAGVKEVWGLVVARG